MMKHRHVVTLFVSMLLALALLLCLEALSAVAQGPVVSGPSPQLEPGQPPAGLSAAEWGSIRNQIVADRYRPRAAEANGYVAANPAHGWQIGYARTGATTLAGNGDWQWGLRLTAYGYGLNLTPVDRPAALTADTATLTYRWDASLREWWVNTPTGLEQGFTLQRRPAPASGLPLVVDMAVNGTLTPQLRGDGIAFTDATGAAILTYNKLHVTDAAGQVIPARFAVIGQTLQILVEDAAAIYPLTIDPIVQQAYLKASNAEADDRFGWAVGISGDTLVVGAYEEASNATGVDGNQSDNSAYDAGAAYVFVRNAEGVWSQQAYLKASNAEADDQFGIAVAISGDTVVVGARYEASSAIGVDGNESDNSAPYSGAAYVFVRSGVTWSQQAYLKASNAGANDYFGSAVAISGNTVVVGAYSEDSSIAGGESNNSATDAGAVYVFVRSGVTWSQQAFLKASNAESPSGFGDGFGSAVAISGDTLVAAAYNEDSNATGVNGNQTNNLASNSGAAYIFTRDGTGAWSQQAYLKASNTGASDMFGIAVAISGDTAVVGASSEDSTVAGGQSNNDAANAGAAYVFTRDGTGAWSQQAFLKASNAQAQDIFGSSVAVSGDTLIVGAYYEASSADGGESDNSTSYSGAAYVFTRSGVTWNQQPYLKASNAGIGDNFGYAVAIDGDSLAVAAPQERSSATGVGGDQDDDSAFGAGAVYISAFVVPPAPDVTLAKTVTPASAQPGQAITYTLTFSNAGNGTATGVVITDSVPVSVTNLSVISSGVVITATGAAPNFIWQVENFAQNAGGVITLTGVLSNPLAAGVFTNTAEIAATGDSNPANNTGSAAISVCGYSATVQNNTDSGAGSLRQAVADVCPGGVISFTLTTPDVITLTTGEIAITKTLTIDGPGKELIAVSGNNASRIFTATAALTIDGVTLRDGNASGHGGAIQTTAPLTLTSMAVISNISTAYGGAIASSGPLVITGSVVAGNVASAQGGAIYNNGGSLALTNTSFSGNSNNAQGGAIYNDGSTAALTNILFSGNRGAVGGAIYNNSNLQLTNVTFSGNRTPNPGGA
ncbi:MAG: hypothetical protein M9936_26805, partial [Caldilinea sp.]|nr:hypothetical protein [Caldilinea sp.]